ncbi:MAG: serpin family protein [Armatimonadetes bacterium]|nr:serpin family protein [Armatimonadota bacterium]
MGPFWALFAVAWCVGAGAQEPSAATVKLVSSQNQFAFDLLRAQPADRDTFASPYSVYQALTMLYVGAKGETRAQLAKALGVDATDDAWLSRNAELRARLVAQDTFVPCQVRIANALFPSRRIAIRAAFIRAATEAVASAEVRTLDYANSEAARATINTWISDHTEGRLPEVLARDAISSETSLVVTNAVYFNGLWAQPFLASDSRPDDFQTLDGRKLRLSFMHQVVRTSYAHGTGWQAVWLQYLSRSLAAAFIVPDEGTFVPFAQRMTQRTWTDIVAKAEVRDIDLAVPRFTLDTALYLTDSLRSLGVRDAFDALKADLSGIGTDPLGTVYSRDAYHQAMVRVDERGTEAAAATAIMGYPGCGLPLDPPLVVRVDRPFVFVIYDLETGALLFAGRVVTPKSDVPAALSGDVPLAPRPMEGLEPGMRGH